MTSQIERVNRYYEASVFDYHTLWTSNKDLGIHFGYYDNTVRSHSDSLLKMNSVLAEKVRISPTDYVLDAGCGYGGTALWLAKHVGCDVVGVTIVPFQKEKAEFTAKKRGLSEKANFYIEDFSATPFSDETFTVVLGLESVVHAEDKAKFIKEAFRLLKKDGRLVIAEYTLREQPPLNEKELASIQRWLEGWAMPNLLTATQYRTFCEDAGFKNIKIENITTRVLPSLQRLKKFIPYGLVVGRLFTRIGIFSRDHLGNIEGSHSQLQALEKAIWQYSIITAVKA